MLKQFWFFYTEPFRKYHTLCGRATRREYWVFGLSNVLLFLALKGLDRATGLYSEAGGIGLFSGMCAFGLAVPSIAVEVRRFHDSNLSGAWFFISLVPVVGVLVNLVQLLRSGTPGPNRFDDDPREQEIARYVADAPPEKANVVGDMNMLKQPKRWWFLIPLPAALCLSFGLTLCCFFVMDRMGAFKIHGGALALFFTLYLTFYYTSLFPTGLVNWFISPEQVMEGPHLLPICCMGYAIYLAMTIAGLLKPKTWLLVAFCLILICNVAGCQMPFVKQVLRILKTRPPTTAGMIR